MRHVAFHHSAYSEGNSVFLQFLQERLPYTVLFEPLLDREENIPARCSDLDHQAERIGRMRPDLTYILTDVRIRPLADVADKEAHEAFSGGERAAEYLFFGIESCRGLQRPADHIGIYGRSVPDLLVEALRECLAAVDRALAHERHFRDPVLIVKERHSKAVVKDVLCAEHRPCVDDIDADDVLAPGADGTSMVPGVES